MPPSLAGGNNASAFRRRGAVSKKLARQAADTACGLPSDLVRIAYGGFGDVFVEKSNVKSTGGSVYKIIPFHVGPNYSSVDQFYSEVDLATRLSRIEFGPKVLSHFSNSDVGVIEMERWGGSLTSLPSTISMMSFSHAATVLAGPVLGLANLGGLCVDIRAENMLWRVRDDEFELTLSDFDAMQCTSWEHIADGWIDDRMTVGLREKMKEKMKKKMKKKKKGGRKLVLSKREVDALEEKLVKEWSPVVRDGIGAILLASASLHLTGYLRTRWPINPNLKTTFKDVFPEFRGGAVDPKHELFFTLILGALLKRHGRKKMTEWLEWFFETPYWHQAAQFMVGFPPVIIKAQRRRSAWWSVKDIQACIRAMVLGEV